MKRRDFLKLGSVGMAALFAGKGDAVVEAAESIEAMPKFGKVDVHAHAILPAYVDGLKRLGINPVAEEAYPLPQWSAEAHLSFMEQANIDYTVLSLPTPHPYRGAEQEQAACEVVRSINEEMAEICRKYPKKFGFAAALPMPSVEGSLAEIRYAMDNLGALGVKMASNSDGVYLGDARFEPIFSELDSRQATIILHPSPARSLPRENVVTGEVMALFEYPADTTRAVLNLIANGVFSRYPNIKLIVPHVGSFLPYMKQRAKAMLSLLAAMGKRSPVDVEREMQSIYYDLAGAPMPDALPMLERVTEMSHILYGSDYPYVKDSAILAQKKLVDMSLEKSKKLTEVYCKNSKELFTKMNIV